MLRNFNESVQANPDTFIKHFDSDDIQKRFDGCKVATYDYEEWQKVEVKVKIRSGGEKTKKKMKVVRKTRTKTYFEQYFQKQIVAFREHVKRIRNQYIVQRDLKENQPPNHIYIHMDFA